MKRNGITLLDRKDAAALGSPKTSTSRTTVPLYDFYEKGFMSADPLDNYQQTP